MVKWALALLGALSLAGWTVWSPPQAPRVWKTDLRIRSLDLMSVGQGSMQATIGVSVEGDDAARAARLEILLPVSVGVIRLPQGCRSSPAAVANLTARVTCDLGDIPGRGIREISVLTSSPPSRAGARYAAMVLSDTPDVTPSNNFAEREVP